MANIRSSNTFFIDTAASDSGASTTGNLALKNVRLLYLVVNATGASPALTLRDVTTSAVKFTLTPANGPTTYYFDFSRKPAVFPNGINPHAVTNCNATLVIEESGA